MLAAAILALCLQVALLDTGLDKEYLKHPAFAGVTITAKNFTTSDVRSSDI